jgi:uncharacterized membrane protein YphA (DoxX/SURF4 family)
VSVAASLISIALFLLFATSGLQKLRFNPMMSQSADHLGFEKKAYQRIGGLELLGALGLLVGLSAKGGFWFLVNWLAAAGLALLVLGAVYFHRKVGDKVSEFAPALVLALVCILELIFRFAQ